MTPKAALKQVTGAAVLVGSATSWSKASRRAVLLVEILAAYPPLLVALRRNDLDRMVGRARSVHFLGPSVPEPSRLDAAIRLGWIVRRTLSQFPSENRCLIRSLVLVRLLTRRGIPNRLVIGISSGEFAAHAWVEHGGHALLPSYGHERLLEL